MSKEMGHVFLRRLGKQKLRPGGIEATSFLLDNMNIKDGYKIAEIACNKGLNLINLAKSNPNCEFYGIDLDDKVIKEGQELLEKQSIKNVNLNKGNAAKLPFEDNSIDIIINEAMLTMMPENAKHRIISEYYRVLKKGGLLLTHDIAIINNEETAIKKLSDSVNINVSPLPVDKWISLFKNIGFETTHKKLGKLSLMNPIGMIKDEGIFNTIKIIFNGLKKENRAQFIKMRKTFMQLKNDINYIALINKK